MFEWFNTLLSKGKSPVVLIGAAAATAAAGIITFYARRTYKAYVPIQVPLAAEGPGSQARAFPPSSISSLRLTRRKLRVPAVPVPPRDDKRMACTRACGLLRKTAK